MIVTKSILNVINKHLLAYPKFEYVYIYEIKFRKNNGKSIHIRLNANTGEILHNPFIYKKL